ncbi:hypothetical protein CBR_g19798 [Chara braunii]|uniref:Uncharacterized protein n=1 Tax=Chara braunii TaxID=69332 RepID=A0A388JTY3_CHABU|nr:hypothetical protein CBR_g19798 [Chara braunii]|eukprot:GBG61266.1 hypothetical protein CBR_g19798 [Chara braunii]
MRTRANGHAMTSTTRTLTSTTMQGGGWLMEVTRRETQREEQRVRTRENRRATIIFDIHGHERDHTRGRMDGGGKDGGRGKMEGGEGILEMAMAGSLSRCLAEEWEKEREEEWEELEEEREEELEKDQEGKWERAGGDPGGGPGGEAGGGGAGGGVGGAGGGGGGAGGGEGAGGETAGNGEECREKFGKKAVGEDVKGKGARRRNGRRTRKDDEHDGWRRGHGLRRIEGGELGRRTENGEGLGRGVLFRTMEEERRTKTMVCGGKMDGGEGGRMEKDNAEERGRTTDEDDGGGQRDNGEEVERRWTGEKGGEGRRVTQKNEGGRRTRTTEKNDGGEVRDDGGEGERRFVDTEEETTEGRWTEEKGGEWRRTTQKNEGGRWARTTEKNDGGERRDDGEDGEQRLVDEENKQEIEVGKDETLEYVCMAFLKIENARLLFDRLHLREIRAEVYQNLHDHVMRYDNSENVLSSQQLPPVDPVICVDYTRMQWPPSNSSARRISSSH